MRDGQIWSKSTKMTHVDFIEILNARIHTIDFKNAAQDVKPFIKDSAELDFWSKEFFLIAVEKLKTE